MVYPELDEGLRTSGKESLMLSVTPATAKSKHELTL
jgi:hypothetical protein